MGKRQRRGKGRSGSSRHALGQPPEVPAVVGVPEVAAAVENTPDFSQLRTPATAGGSIVDPGSGDVRAQIAQFVGRVPGLPTTDTTASPTPGTEGFALFLGAVAVALIARYVFGLGWPWVVGLFVLVLVVGAEMAKRARAGA